ncbi:MAG: aminopeptidase P family protein [Chloroflexi bacterium]|nr:aminopeptidase P family protein [Chloroflexota bacterium]
MRPNTSEAADTPRATAQQPPDPLPWPEGEFARRWRRAQAMMAEAGFDGLIASESTNFRYLAGYESQQFIHKMRPMVFILPRRGDPALFIYGLEAPNVLALGVIRDVSSYVDVPFPVGDLARLLRERGLGSGVLGVERGPNQRLGMPLDDFLALQAALPEVAWRDAGALLDGVQMVKSEAEVEMVRRACAITEQAWPIILSRLSPGITMIELQRQVTRTFVEHGADPVTPGRSAVYRLSDGPASPRFQSGDVLKLDFGARYNGYYCDVARLATFGASTERHRDIHRQVAGLLRDCIAAARPGVRAREIMAFNNAALGRMGQPPIPGTKRIGHGIGVGYTQPPSLNVVDETPLAPGMVIAVEPRIETELGMVHLEEMVLVTESGPRALTTGAAELGRIG